MNITVSVLFALMAAAMFGMSSVIQRAAASGVRAAQALRLSLLWQLIHRPRWVAAFGLTVLSFGALVQIGSWSTRYLRNWPASLRLAGMSETNRPLCLTMPGHVVLGSKLEVRYMKSERRRGAQSESLVPVWVVKSSTLPSAMRQARGSAASPTTARIKTSCFRVRTDPGSHGSNTRMWWICVGAIGTRPSFPHS